jgi:hypothetical protein
VTALVVFIVAVALVGCSKSSGTKTATTKGGVTPVSVRIAPTDSAPTCRQAVATGTVDALLSAFRAARIKSNGAEECLTAGALSAYCTSSHPCSDEVFQASPGPICLYECRGYRVRDIAFDVSRAADGTVTVYCQVELAKDPASPTPTYVYMGRQNESLTIGRGVPVGAAGARPVVVVEATTSA